LLTFELLLLVAFWHFFVAKILGQIFSGDKKVALLLRLGSFGGTKTDEPKGGATLVGQSAGWQKLLGVTNDGELLENYSPIIRG